MNLLLRAARTSTVLDFLGGPLINTIGGYDFLKMKTTLCRYLFITKIIATLCAATLLAGQDVSTQNATPKPAVAPADQKTHEAVEVFLTSLGLIKTPFQTGN